jgi:hypothetical protein
MKAYVIRVYFEVQGGHTHCRVFTGEIGATLGKAGDLTMTNDEFKSWYFGRHNIEFIGETKDLLA